MAKRTSSSNSDADISEEIDAKPVNPDEPNGLMTADEEKVREAGALDLESIRANRRNLETIKRKEGGETRLPFGDPNVCMKYENVITTWPLNTIAIVVNRLTGTPAQYHITTQPKNGIELYNELKTLHGRREETTYELLFRDSYKKEYRGSGRITLPSTLDEPMQQ